MSEQDDYASEQLAKYREKVGASQIYGVRVDSLSRDDLLGVIGFLMADKQELESRHKSTVDMYRRFA